MYVHNNEDIKYEVKIANNIYELTQTQMSDSDVRIIEFEIDVDDKVRTSKLYSSIFVGYNLSVVLCGDYMAIYHATKNVAHSYVLPEENCRYRIKIYLDDDTLCGVDMMKVDYDKKCFYKSDKRFLEIL